MYAGKKLRSLRLQLDINQSEMAVSLGLSQSYYSSVESGKRRITPKMIEKIKDKYQIDGGYFEQNSDEGNNKNMGGKTGGFVGGLNDKSNTLIVGKREQESRRFKPYFFYNQLTDNDLEFEISLEIEDFKDAYNDHVKLTEALHELNAPDFLLSKFPVPQIFAEYKLKVDEDFNQEHKRLKDKRKLNLLILVDLYQEQTDHWHRATSKLISYLHQYSQLILKNNQEDIKNGVSILNKAAEIKKKRTTR